jgi:hypothetical protein
MTNEATALADQLDYCAKHKSYWSYEDQLLATKAATFLRASPQPSDMRELEQAQERLAFEICESLCDNMDKGENETRRLAAKVVCPERVRAAIRIASAPITVRVAAQAAYDFPQDKSFIPDSDTHKCTKILKQLDAALSTPTPAPAVSGDVREIIAMIIDPRAFTGWQGQCDNALKNNDADFAQRCADHYYKVAIDDAMIKAGAILALATAGGTAKQCPKCSSLFILTMCNEAGDGRTWLRCADCNWDQKSASLPQPKTDPGEPAGIERLAQDLAERIVSMARERDSTCELKYDETEVLKEAKADLLAAFSQQARPQRTPRGKS